MRTNRGSSPNTEQLALRETLPSVESPTLRALQSQAVYRSGERLVRLADAATAHDVASAHGCEVLREPGRSGYAVLSGTSRQLEAVSADGRVLASLPHAVTHGATTVREFQGQLESLQYYVDLVDPPESGWTRNGSVQWEARHPASDFVVAVLDTGVAYETARRQGVRYTAAPSLRASRIVAPRDFVNNDAHANDDHQHGTHIASLIAASNTTSELQGIAPGASIMPVKVLDEHNQGVEIDLVNGLWHAIDHGADVINMSLSFSEGYRPSAALQEALQAAHDAGIVMIGAAGNDGADYVSWPAASPLVFAVGSATYAPSGQGEYETQTPAGYSNVSAGIDLMVVGGDLSSADADPGLPADGILAEAVSPDDPSQVGYWLMAGTSQAAAVASGIAVTLLQDETPPSHIPIVLAAHGRHGSVYATKDRRIQSYNQGFGAGFLDMHWGDELQNAIPEAAGVPVRHVALMPFLERVRPGVVRPAARVTLFTQGGGRVGNQQILGQLYGTDSGMVDCKTNWRGQCVLLGNEVSEFDASGAPRPVAVLFSVEKVLDDSGFGHSPRVAVTATPELQELIAQLRASPQTANAMLGWAFHEVNDDVLGRVAPSYSLVDSGSGLASIPLGMVLSRPEFQQFGPGHSTLLRASGVDLTAELRTLDGSGLASIPLGIRNLRILTIDAVSMVSNGSGLASLPLGLRPTDLLGDGSKVARLDQPGVLRGTALGDQIAEGGWSLSGYGVVTVLSSSSRLAIAPTWVAGFDGEGHGAMRFE